MVRSGHEGGVDAKGCLRMKEKRLQRGGESEGAPPSEVRNAGVPPANENGAGRADGPQGYAPDPTGGMRW